MKNAHQWFAEYGESHKNSTNKLIHWICVPTIFFSVIGLLASIPANFLQELFPAAIAPYVHFGTLLILIGSLFYLTMSFTIFVGMLVVSALVLLGNAWISQSFSTPLWLICLVLFVAAWIGQFVGHEIEGKKPSFLKDLLFLLVGPAWLLGFVYKKLGIPY